jgi:DNA-binding protein HU-beta
MNKAKVIDQMSKITKLPKTTVKECLEAFVATIGNALKQGKSVALTGFGTFSVMKRKARPGVNPATGKKMTIPAKKVPKFKPSKALKAGIK